MSQVKRTRNPITDILNSPHPGSPRFRRCDKVLSGGTLEDRISLWDASNESFTELPVIPGHHGGVPSIVICSNAKGLLAAVSYCIQDVGGMRYFAFNEKRSDTVDRRQQTESGGFVPGSQPLIDFNCKSGKAKPSIQVTAILMAMS